MSDNVKGQDPAPTVYQYYTEGGVKKGLEALPEGFKLNGKEIIIQSGAIHYFRVHPKYWRDRLIKLRATGLIAVETYVPWNLHEPEPDNFDFGHGDSDMSEFLDIVQFIKLAQELDLLVILRPGPYICAEWEFGGFPSWLLRYPGIKLRTSEEQYVDRVRNYFNKLLPLVTDLQFTKGGPIIAVQLENEYATVGYIDGPDSEYMKILKEIVESNGIKELLFTSDSDSVDSGSLPGVLKTINFQNNARGHLEGLVTLQRDKPPMVMEYWTGWFDWWMFPASHLSFSSAEFAATLETIMSFPASFNLYMFHGGTSWGFLNGGNGLSAPAQTFDVTSYDYGAPLSESGDYTEKYTALVDLVEKYKKIDFAKVDKPPETLKHAYQSLLIESYVDFNDIYEASADKRVNSKTVVNAESLNINNNSGQSYGYTLYRKKNANVQNESVLVVSGHVHDVLEVMVDGQLKSKVLNHTTDILGFGYWIIPDGRLVIENGGSTLDLLVENYGRLNFGHYAYSQKKGLYEGPVYLDDVEVEDWEITAIDFKRKWVEELTASSRWKPYTPALKQLGPTIYRATLEISDIPKDTFLNMSRWIRGVVFVNGFNLGRYNFLGPPRTLFLPAPLLKQGSNTILVFEHYKSPGSVTFLNHPVLDSYNEYYIEINHTIIE